ncbi:MAG TPA: DsrE family protein [bacterium]|nr:DsrE family protein [bacterium]
MTNPKHTQTRSLALLLTKKGMGQAEPEFQLTLLQKYLRLLEESDTLSEAICLYAAGVKLVVGNFLVLDHLQRMESKGGYVLVCHTCLQYFGLTDRVRVGIVGGMTDIIAAQWKADKVITL